MKKVTGALVLVLIVGICSYVAEGHAQMGPGLMGQGMMAGMGPGMMHMKGMEACGGMHCGGMDLMKILHHWAACFFMRKDELKITEQQLDQIEAIINSHIKYAIRKNADRRVLLIEIQELFLKEKSNLKEVEAKVKALETLTTEMETQGIRTLQEALNVLPPEQQKAAKALFKKSTFMRAMGIGPMHGGMGGQKMKEMMGD